MNEAKVEKAVANIYELAHDAISGYYSGLRPTAEDLCEVLEEIEETIEDLDEEDLDLNHVIRSRR